VEKKSKIKNTLKRKSLFPFIPFCRLRLLRQKKNISTIST
jgi:hypothetical protein